MRPYTAATKAVDSSFSKVIVCEYTEQGLGLIK